MEVNFFNEVNQNDDNKDLMDEIFDDSFLLWNRTQNIAYEFSDNKYDLFMDGFEREEKDKIYILDVKQNSLIDYYNYDSLTIKE